MKNHMTMLGILNIQSVNIGPRPTPGRARFGYYLTMAEIREIYAKNGFNVSLKSRRKTLPNHIQIWEELELIKLDGDVMEPDTVVWFGTPQGCKTSLMVAAEKAGYDADRVVV